LIIGQLPNDEKCGVSRCKGYPTIKYKLRNIYIPTCERHWELHCDDSTGFTLKYAKLKKWLLEEDKDA